MKLSKTHLLLIACATLAGVLLTGVARPVILDSSHSIVSAQAKGKEAVEAARAALDEAMTNEKRSRTKEAALAVDEALQAYNAAVAERVLEVQAALKELAQS